jgi:diguanylate cyclase (GGDEF)-like protein
LIVDTFLRVHAFAPKQLPRVEPPNQVLKTIADTRHTSAPTQASATFDEITTSADEMLTVYELARALAGQVSLSDAGDVIVKHLIRLIPSSLCVFYLYDAATDELEARHAVGEGSSLVIGIRISLGQRLSGWVAANRLTISNSDPALDLGDTAKSNALNLRSCISTTLLSEDALVGVITLYSDELNGFNEDHRRIIEAVARQIAHTFKSATLFEHSSRRDALTGLPARMQLEQFVDATGIEHLVQKSTFALLFIDVVGLKQINTLHGRAVGDAVLRHVVRHSTAGLRLADILFRYGSGELVALLNDTDAEAARFVARRIRDGIRNNPLVMPTHRSINIDVSVTEVTSPNDGASLAALVDAARQRTRGIDGKQEESTIH